MGKKTIEIITCDVCEEKTKNEEVEITVIFTTEQNEGKKCNKYLELEKLYLCDHCYITVINGRQIYAQGAMGNNKYYF